MRGVYTYCRTWPKTFNHRKGYSRASSPARPPAHVIYLCVVVSFCLYVWGGVSDRIIAALILLRAFFSTVILVCLHTHEPRSTNRTRKYGHTRANASTGTHEGSVKARRRKKTPSP